MAKGMLQAVTIDKVLLELTSRCNLKCPFCTLSHPEYKGGDSSFDVDQLIPILKRSRVKKVEVNNHGESTIVLGWEKVAQKLLENGFSVSITSNLAKAFSEEEIATLADLTVYLSIDTIEPELFRKLRLGAYFNRVIQNVEKIQLEKKRKKTGTAMGWRTIICDATYLGVPQLIEYGLALGVSEFYFGHLQKMIDVKTSYNLKHLCDLTDKEIEEALSILNVSKKTLDEACVVHDLDKFIDELIYNRKPTIISYIEPDPKTSSPFEPASRETYSEEVPPGWTRNCLLPWNMAQIKYNQNITFCCWMKSLGNLKNSSFEDIINGEIAQKYREGLLTGQLMTECKTCPVRKPIPLKYQFQNVSDYLGRNETDS